MSSNTYFSMHKTWRLYAVFRFWNENFLLDTCKTGTVDCDLNGPLATPNFKNKASYCLHKMLRENNDGYYKSPVMTKVLGRRKLIFLVCLPHITHYNTDNSNVCQFTAALSITHSFTINEHSILK
jgi:hypothetical protein